MKKQKKIAEMSFYPQGFDAYVSFAVEHKKKFALERAAIYGKTEVYIPKIQNLKPNNALRAEFESWLFSQGLVLVIRNGNPYIGACQEENLSLFLLKWS